MRGWSKDSLPSENEFKQEPHRWAWRLGITILDPDGWRRDGKDFHEPVTKADFLDRAAESTIRVEPGSNFLKEAGL